MDATEARTHHMRRLVLAAGGPAEWTRRYGGVRWSQPQVSQWISETAPKSIGNRLARDLEAVQGLDHGDLDRIPEPDAGPISPVRKVADPPLSPEDRLILEIYHTLTPTQQVTWKDVGRAFAVSPRVNQRRDAKP